MSSTSPPDNGFPSNPFALASILQAAESTEIVAARDIVDDHGIKLLAANLSITPRLHQQLIDRKLRHPLETSLRVVDGVTHDHLVRELYRFVDGPEPLARFVAPLAAPLTPAVASLPLPPVVQLLLTTTHRLQPDTFSHAVRAMALAGALTCALAPKRQPTPQGLVDALHAGLLHDIGDFYLNPAYQGLKRPLLPAEFRHLAAHPQVGALLLRHLAGAPPAVCQAVAEHHERLDGSGYPAQAQAAQLSPLGQLIAVVEVALGLATGHAAQMRHAAEPCDAEVEAARFARRLDFVLRFVGGELNHTAYGPLVRWARTQMTAVPLTPEPAPTGVLTLAEEMTALGQLLDQLLRLVDALAGHRDAAAARVAGRARHRLSRLRLAGHAMGLWLPAEMTPEASDAEAASETVVLHGLARRELRHRLQSLRRDCLWPETEAELLVHPALAPLWQEIDDWLATTR
ncbi:HD-GYP domain-containing protein [Aquabacterium sp. OR-4]|uniref:HD-GYP domain-containing protein n=1 Tax=Aquabacterium sp. OR-4 TaxID=2978127 RepID=UPI0021B1B703|nr:HD domain-containing phosphohydrolase [Aquabacterium sp. OR-4]MDT7836725.1 HD domain-containing phosphohydrolase [Aquabacterium sp. OR-4]